MNRCITPTERNYWMRRVGAEKTDTQPIRTRADILEDALYAAALITGWAIGTYLMAWKTVPGGIEALPTFLILEALITVYVIAAWVKTR